MSNDAKIAALLTTAIKLAGGSVGSDSAQPPVTVPPSAAQPPAEPAPSPQPPANNVLPANGAGVTPVPLTLDSVKHMTADQINERWDEVSQLLQGEDPVAAPSNVTHGGTT